jgi:hypothetical protein
MGKRTKTKKPKKRRPAHGEIPQDGPNEQPPTPSELANRQPQEGQMEQLSRAERWRISTSTLAVVVAVIAIIQPYCATVRAQRAYMLIDSIRIDPPMDASRPTTIRAVLKNTGTTPARDVIAEFGVNMGQAPERPNTSVSNLVQDTRRFAFGDMGAAQTRSAVVRVGVFPTQLKDIQSGKLRLYVTATITYKDVFFGWIARNTEACAFLIEDVFSPCEGYSRLD